MANVTFTPSLYRGVLTAGPLYWRQTTHNLFIILITTANIFINIIIIIIIITYLITGIYIIYDS